MKSSNQILKFVNIMNFINIMLIMCICMFTFYWADDYNFLFDISKKGIINNCIHNYFNWDGRFLSLSAFVQAFLLKFIKIEFVTLFWCICFLLSGFLLAKTTLNQLKIKLSLPNMIGFCLTIMVFFFYSARPHMAQTIFWGTGGVYSFSLFLGSLWIYIYVKNQELRWNYTKKILFLIFSFIIGSTSQNLSIAIITLILFDNLIFFLTDKTKLKNYNLLIFIFVILGLSLIMLSPGNLKRLSEINEYQNKISFFDLINNFLYVLKSYFHSMKYGIATFIICILSIKLLITAKSINQIPVFNFCKNGFLITFFKKTKWLFVALSTITPFIVMPIMASERTMIFFHFFIFLFLLTLFFDNNNFTYRKIKYANYIGLLLLITIYSKSIVFLAKNINSGIELKKIISERENLLESSKNKEVTIKIISEKYKTDCFKFYDFKLDNDPKYFMIVGYKNYFNLKKINIEE